MDIGEVYWTWTLHINTKRGHGKWIFDIALWTLEGFLNLGNFTNLVETVESYRH